MERNFLKTLIDWKNNNVLVPLMVVGARQIGKTYIIDKFCKENFQRYIYINLEQKKEIFNLFEESIDPKDLIPRIELELNTVIDIENTVIFIDEIQVSERAITSLKYFCESNEKFKIIVAGSLLGVKLNRFNSSFPVGKVDIKYMFPMTFDEFLLAIDRKNLLLEIEKHYNSMTPISETIHKLALKYYRDYLCIGGMPVAILEYIKNEYNVVHFNKEITKTIITSYLADMTKYTFSSSEAVKITSIYNKMPNQLAKENKKFTYTVVDKNASKKTLETSLDWLISSNMVYKTNLVKLPQMPLKAYVEDNTFKIYLNDVGLLSSLCDIEFKDIVLEKEFMFRGVLTENYVASVFKANNKNLYFWKSSNMAEVDFILQTEDGIIPVEVKSSENTKSKSLNMYIQKYNPTYAIRISSKNFGVFNNIKSIPLYAIHLI